MPTEADQSTSLVVLFERFFAHERTAEGSYASKFRNALKWFRLYLEREPTVADIDTETVSKFFQYCLRKGQSLATVRCYRTRLGTLQRYAVQHGMGSGVLVLPSVTGTVRARVKKRGLPRLGTLRHFFEFTYLPGLVDLGTGKHCLESYRAVLTWIQRWHGSPDVEINTLDAAAVARFADWIGNALTPTTAKRYAGHLRAMLEAAGRIEVVTDAKSCDDCSAEHAEGTLRHYLFATYVIEREISNGAIKQIEFAVRGFSQHLGHEAMIGDLTAPKINGWIITMQKQFAAATVKNKRNAILGLWRSAWDSGATDVLVRGIRKVSVRYSTEAWTADEVAALLRAVDRLYGERKTYTLIRKFGVSKHLFWRSLLLAAWDSALRRGDLMALTIDDFQEQADGSGIGVVEQSKTRRLVKFVLRAETVVAIRQCVASGNKQLRGRKQIWGSVIGSRSINGVWETIVASAANEDGVRVGPFKWLRRASITAREIIEEGLGSLAAGHSHRQTTVRHYRDARQIPAPPPPPALILPPLAIPENLAPLSESAPNH